MRNRVVLGAVLFLGLLWLFDGSAYATVAVTTRAPQNRVEISGVARHSAGNEWGCQYNGFNQTNANQHLDSIPNYNARNVLFCRERTYVRPWIVDRNASSLYRANIIDAYEGDEYANVYIVSSIVVAPSRHNLAANCRDYGHVTSASTNWPLCDSYKSGRLKVWPVTTHMTNIKAAYYDMRTYPDSARLIVGSESDQRNGGSMIRGGTIYPIDGAIGLTGVLGRNEVPAKIRIGDLKAGTRTLRIGIHVCNRDTLRNYSNSEAHKHLITNDGLRECWEFGMPVTLNIKPQDKKWQGESLTTANRTTAQPGQTITFTHTIKTANGGKKVGTNVRWGSKIVTKAGTTNGRSGNTAQNTGIFVTTSDSYTVKASDMGSNICSYIEYSPAHLNSSVSTANNQTATGSGGAKSAQKCVYIPYKSDPKPCVRTATNNCGGRENPGEPGEKTPVELDPGGDPGDGIKYQFIVTRWRIPAEYEGVNRDAVTKELTASKNSDTCAVYNSAPFFSSADITNCSARRYTTWAAFNAAKKIELTLRSNAPIGEQECVALSVSPSGLKEGQTEAQQKELMANSWVHSSPLCKAAGNKPKFQVWNGGVFSSRGITTSATRLSSGQINSWAEYEVLANGTVSNFRAGAGSALNRLMFSNANASSLGNYRKTSSHNTQVVESIRSKYPQTSSDAGVNARTRITRYTGNYTLSSNAINSNNVTRVIYADKIAISANQQYQRIGQQLIIVANEIYIRPGVTRVDGILIGSTRVVTCADGFVENTSNNFINYKNCNRQLMVNGAILTNSLKSYRTYGAESTDAAEIYNQRPDMYIWADSVGDSDSYVKTTYTKELPVRY